MHGYFASVLFKLQLNLQTNLSRLGTTECNRLAVLISQPLLYSSRALLSDSDISDCPLAAGTSALLHCLGPFTAKTECASLLALPLPYTLSDSARLKKCLLSGVQLACALQATVPTSILEDFDRQLLSRQAKLQMVHCQQHARKSMNNARAHRWYQCQLNNCCIHLPMSWHLNAFVTVTSTDTAQLSDFI